MKLSDYFEQQRNSKLTDLQKMHIYDNFISKVERVSILKRVSFYGKVSVYTVFLVVLMLLFYYPYVSNQISKPKINISHVGTGFFVQDDNMKNNQGVAVAGNIGKIIESQGDFRIIKDGQEIDTDLINEGDTILLSNDAELKFLVSSGTNAFIKGPAKFNINFIGYDNAFPKYVLNLEYGKYFEIKTQENISENLVIKTQQMEIESKDLTGNMDLNITSNGNKQIIQNKGSEIVVKKVINNKKTFALVKTNQTAQVDEDIKLLEAVQQIKSEIKSNSLQMSYEIGKEEPKSSSGDSSVVDITNDTKGVSIDGNSDYLVTKDVLTQDKMDALKTVLTPSFMMKDIEKLSVTYVNGEDNGFKISYKQFYSRVNKLYDIFGKDIGINGGDSIEDLYIITKEIITSVKSDYYLPERYIQRLDVMLKWLEILNSAEYGVAKGQNIDFNGIFDILNLQDKKADLILTN